MQSLNHFAIRLEKFNYSLSLWFERIAIVAVVGIIASVMIDVIGSKVFHWPLPGGTEIVYLFQVISIAGALAISKIDGRHVRIELIDKLPQPGLGIIHALVALLSLGLFVILGWKGIEFALSLKINNEVTATSKLPLFPFALWMAMCCLPMVLILIKDFISSLVETVKK